MGHSTYEEVGSSTVRLSRGSLLRTLAVTALVSTLLLIMVGSYVRVSGNGLGCPDWPLCYGRAVPPMKYGAWVEFSHRLLGGIVSLQIVGLSILAWADFRNDKWIFRPAILVLGVLILQVSLGGLHVLNELPRWTGLVHTGVAMAVAGLLAVLVAATQPALQNLRRELPDLFSKTTLATWSIVGAAATYLLLLTGSLVTRTGSSLACPAFPNCGLADVPEQLQSYVTIQLIHRFSAFTVAFAIVLTVWFVLRFAGQKASLRIIAYSLIGLLVIQFGLGISNVLLALPMWSRVLHLGVGGSIWALMVILAVALNRVPAHES
jgi:heme A synthase